MYTCKDYQEVADCFEEAQHPLQKEEIDSMRDTDRVLRQQGVSREWINFMGKCRICNYEIWIITPAANGGGDYLDNILCTNCDNPAVQEKEPNEWE